MSRKPSEEAKYQFYKRNWIGHLLGIHYFNGNEMSPRFLFFVSLGLVEQYMHFSCFYAYRSDTISVISLCMVECLVVQLFTRLVSKLLFRKEQKMMSLLKTIVAFYEREEQTHGLFLLQTLKNLEHLLDVYLLTFAVLYALLNPAAWILSWYSDEFILFTPIYFPFIDPQTLVGYVISAAVLLLYSVIVFLCFMADDVLFMFFVYQCVPMIDIFCMKLKGHGDELIKIKMKMLTIVREEESKTSKVAWQLKKDVNREMVTDEKHMNELIHEMNNVEQPSKSKDTAKGNKYSNDIKVSEIARVEKQLIDLIQEFNVYNDYVRTSFKIMILAAFIVLTFNYMAIGVVVILMNEFSVVIGVTGFLLFTAPVLTFCMQGSLVKYQKEKALTQLPDFPWYELTLSSQKIFLQFIHLIQFSNELKIPIIGELNMELFTGIMNGAYAFFTYLLNFF